MSPRNPAARIAILLFAVLYAAPGRADSFADAAGRHVAIPARVERVIAADPAAAVLVYVLAPQKLVGWPTALSYGQRRYLPARYARLPVTGAPFGDRYGAGEVARWRPDLVVAVAAPAAAARAAADRLQAGARVPVIVLSGSIQDTPAALRQAGAVLGVVKRGDELATQADNAISEMRGRLLIQSANDRPLVYYGKGYDGLTTPLAVSPSLAAIDEAGAIDVAAPLPAPVSGEKRVAAAQLRRWDPDVAIAERRAVADAWRRDWPGLKAVRNRRVYAAPEAPFGWIDDPPGVNRLIGLYWLSAVMYPGGHRSLGAQVQEFYDNFYGIKLSDPQIAALVRQAEAKPGEFSATTNSPGLLTPGAAVTPNGLLGNPPAPYARPPGRRGLGLPGQMPPTGLNP